MNPLIKAYYKIRPLIPRSVQIRLRRILMRRQRATCGDTWPIDERAAAARPAWTSWPGDKKFAVVLTHDVELASGVKKCESLMELEQSLGFRSSFNFVAERYTTPPALREKLKAEGFEVGVHGLLHDGKLYNSKNIFMERAAKINRRLEEWNAVGFRSPSMQHNLDWLHELNILYDASTFDTDPFEPDNSAECTIFPFWVPANGKNGGYAELPYTLPQDSSLYLFLQETDISIWKQKTDWIAREGGMVLVNVHPDYMNFSGRPCSAGEYPSGFYKQFLEYILSEYKGQYWHALPREVARFTAQHYQKTGEEV